MSSHMADHVVDQSSCSSMFPTCVYIYIYCVYIYILCIYIICIYILCIYIYIYYVYILYVVKPFIHRIPVVQKTTTIFVAQLRSTHRCGRWDASLGCLTRIQFSDDVPHKMGLLRFSRLNRGFILVCFIYMFFFLIWTLQTIRTMRYPEKWGINHPSYLSEGKTISSFDMMRMDLFFCWFI